jgi:DNA repair protein RecO (recombination protein O)
MGTLTGVEADGPSVPLTGERLLAGFYLNELVLRLLGRHDPNPEFYALYVEALEGLSGDGGTAPVLRAFEKRALDCLGYGLPLSTHALDGSDIQPQARYRFDVQAGARPVGAGDSTSVGGDTLLALYHEAFDEPGCQADMRRLLASALAVHLGGRPLQSARVLRDLRRRGWGGGREPASDTGEDQ